MEGITMINAEKTVVSGLSAKTASTIAATDLVQLYANDGTPNGKISKADLMETVKASLPALLSDQDTNGKNFLTLLTDGTLGKTTLANAASLLGALIYSTNIKEVTTVTELNAETGDSKRFSRYFVSTQSSPANLPDGVSSTRFFLEIYNMSNYYILQKIYIAQASNFAIYYRSKFGDNNWTNWKTIA